ncbi:Microsomal glutathione S-transferase 1 [Holothuria leucospilota]|uniref:Microsomal glutathione S-transferase 1 n=1 Tax=Holothuria leucospilota TaxID=206669 RepID=A0A9Q1C4H2_HOLLE|nr:Microsomal glutathione S-transferase 1 [Holothuria leucospilota]
MFVTVSIFLVFNRHVQVFLTKEDYVGFSGDLELDDIRRRLSVKDPEIERIRSCHRNDMENIPAFLAVGLLYVITNPREDLVSLHFRIFTLSRIVHTIAYLLPLPQPSRFLGFLIGTLSIVSMAVQTLISGKL